jgi:transposase InsO family protein
MDFASDGLADGRRLRCLTIVDDCARECVAIEVDTLSRARKDGIGRAVEEVIERERRNLQRASAVLVSLTVAAMYEEDQIAADDLAYVAREVIDRAVEALDRVELQRAVDQHKTDLPS